MIKKWTQQAGAKGDRRSSRWQSLMLAAALQVGVLGIATQAQAQNPDDIFDTQVIQFSEETTVEFEFIESHGAFQSAFGVVNLDTGEETILFQETKPYDAFGTGQRQPSAPGQNNVGSSIDFLGTVAGGTMQNQSGESSPYSEYTFESGTRYALFLQSVSPTGQTRRRVISNSESAALFAGSLDGGTQQGITGTRVAWDDDGLETASKDTDFDDFVIEAGGYLVTVACPPVE